MPLLECSLERKTKKKWDRFWNNQLRQQSSAQALPEKDCGPVKGRKEESIALVGPASWPGLVQRDWKAVLIRSKKLPPVWASSILLQRTGGGCLVAVYLMGQRKQGWTGTCSIDPWPGQQSLGICCTWSKQQSFCAGCLGQGESEIATFTTSCHG